MNPIFQAVPNEILPAPRGIFLEKDDPAVYFTGEHKQKPEESS